VLGETGVGTKPFKNFVEGKRKYRCTRYFKRSEGRGGGVLRGLSKLAGDLSGREGKHTSVEKEKKGDIHSKGVSGSDG